MGVFARLLGRSKAAPEASAAVADAGPGPDGTEVERTAARAGMAGAEEVSGDGAVRSDSGPDDASGGAGIPRQQSSGGAADSEAGEGARR
ncbi:hypothetical protein [Streptomyces sp. NPDC013455]|uniref:hypothetical protein n=1 Tax=Streptomyces sp. NPDC013455 TaxID=3155605 RepID=UPI0033CE04A2